MGSETASASTSVSAAAQVMFWLAVVIAVIVFCGWLLRRFSGQHFGGGSSMRVLASLPVSGRDRLALVQVGDQQILLGISPGRINTLHVFDEPVISDGSIADSPLDRGSDSDFARKLHSLLHRNN